MSGPAGPAYTYRATCRRVIDGDTLVADVDLGFRVTVAINVRIAGVNAPEHNKPGGPEAKAYLRGLVGEGPTATPLLLESHHDAMSFARWVCDIWTISPPAGVAQAIIAAGHGVAFDPKVDAWKP